MNAAMEKHIRDGRRLRSERTKMAATDAALALIEEGVLIPTAKQVCDRAGVGPRTFFRHFDDKDAFFDAVNERAREFYARPFIGGNREGSTAQRIERAVAKRGAGFDKVRNIALSSQAQLWRSSVIRKHHARALAALRADLENWLPEVKALSAADQEAVHLVSSFNTWHSLRDHQRLSRKTSVEVVVRLLTGLVPNHTG